MLSSLPIIIIWFSRLFIQKLVIKCLICIRRASLWLRSKESHAMQELQEKCVLSLGQEDPVEEGLATYFSVLSWRIPWTEEPGGLQSRRSQRVRHD